MKQPKIALPHLQVVMLAAWLVVGVTAGVSAAPPPDDVVSYIANFDEQADAVWELPISPREVIRYEVSVGRYLVARDDYGPAYAVVAMAGKSRCRLNAKGKIGHCTAVGPRHGYEISDEAFEFDPLLRRARARFRAGRWGLVRVTWDRPGDYENWGRPMIGAPGGAGVRWFVWRNTQAKGFVLDRHLGRRQLGGAKAETGLIVFAMADVCLCGDAVRVQYRGP